MRGARNITRFAMYIPKMIHLAELNEEGLICYDGNHRREVFNLLQKDFLCIIDIIFNATQEDVFTHLTHRGASVDRKETTLISLFNYPLYIWISL